MRATSNTAARVHTPTRASRPAGALHAVERSHRYDGVTTRADRIRSWTYVAMSVLCAAVLVAAAITAIVS
jgi:hypothetical protein